MDIQEIYNAYQEGDINALKAYVDIKEVEKEFTDNLKAIQKELQSSEEFQRMFQEVENEGGKYGNCSLSSNIRKSYKFDEYEPYAEKKDELKEIEKTLKFVVDKSEKGQTVNDEEGNIIDPVSVSYTTVYVVKRNRK